MPRIRSVNPPGADVPGISQAMIVERRSLLYLSVHTPLGPNGKMAGDFDGRLQQVIRNLRATLAEAGSDLSALVKLTFYVVGYDGSQLERLCVVRDRSVNTADPPASALIGVAARFRRDVLVEVAGIAVLPVMT